MHTNKTGNNEEGRKAYLNFLSQIKFPSKILDEVYHSQYAQIAYSKEELELFKEKWSA